MNKAIDYIGAFILCIMGLFICSKAGMSFMISFYFGSVTLALFAIIRKLNK